MSLREHFADDAAHSRVATATAVRLPLHHIERRVTRRGDAGEARSLSFAQAFLKRALDVAGAAALFSLLTPLLVVVAVLIRVDSRGPALFRQTRLGLNGRPFRILKFRTMYVLEDGDDVRQAERDDARVTRIGRVLRATSLDELPQLLNVLKGEMSLVGPRPHAVAHDRLYGASIADYSLRQRVKPGITGWAQINGFRGSTSTLEAMRRRIGCDIWYARNANILLDVRILLRTPLEVFRRRNAF